MKKTAIYVFIAMLIVIFAVNNMAVASEVTGTISTAQSSGEQDQNQGNNDDNEEENDDEDGDDSDTSSEVTGNLGSDNTVGTTSPQIAGTVEGGSVARDSRVSLVHTYYYPEEQTQATTTATTTLDSDQLASYALLDFGPRFGVDGRFTPGPPDAGSDMSSLSVRSNPVGNNLSALEDEDLFDFPPNTFVARNGEGIVSSDNLAANAIVSGTGLTIQQLFIIAAIGLVLLASMGYAISKTS